MPPSITSILEMTTKSWNRVSRWADRLSETVCGFSPRMSRHSRASTARRKALRSRTRRTSAETTALSICPEARLRNCSTNSHSTTADTRQRICYLTSMDAAIPIRRSMPERTIDSRTGLHPATPILLPIRRGTTVSAGAASTGTTGSRGSPAIRGSSSPVPTACFPTCHRVRSILPASTASQQISRREKMLTRVTMSISTRPGFRSSSARIA